MTANPAPVSTAPVLPLPPAKETPYKSRTTDLLIFREGQLGDKRDAVIEDLGNMVPEVDLDWFFENLLPPMPKGIDTATVVEQLRKSGVVTENGWAGFSLNPQDERRHEDVVFAQLQPIFKAISDTVQELDPSLQQTFTLLLQPTKYPTSERACTSKPDNCWVAIEDVERIKNDPGRFYTWYNIAGPAEDKKLPESCREQRNKVRFLITVFTSPFAQLVSVECRSDCLQHATNYVPRSLSSVYLRYDDAGSRTEGLVCLSRICAYYKGVRFPQGMFLLSGLYYAHGDVI